MVADYNPGGTRTTKTGRGRFNPNLLDFWNHKWFREYADDFLQKNILENNGIISGCVISDGGGNSIDVTSGEAFIGGKKITVAAPANYPTPGDGWHVVYVDNTGTVQFEHWISGDIQTATTQDDAAIIGFALEGNAAFQVFPYYNESSDLPGLTNTQHVQPDVTVGIDLATDPRATNVETDFIAALSAGNKLLFLAGITLTADREITGQVDIMADGPDVPLALNTFDLTLNECSGYISLTTVSGTLILNGATHGLIINGSVTVEEGSSFSGSYFLNGKPIQKDQLIRDNDVDHVIGTSAQVNADPEEATVYYDSSTSEFRDKTASIVNFSLGDRLLWAGIDTLTADIDISTIDDLKHKMAVGFTLPLAANNFLLGTNQSGDLNVSGTATLTITGSSGLRVLSSGGLSIDNQSGDIVINNAPQSAVAIDWEAVGLIIGGLTTTTIDVDAEKIQLIDDNNVIKIIENLNLTLDTSVSGAGGIDTGSVGSLNTYYIWIIAKADGTESGVLSLSSTSPTLPTDYTFKGNVGRITTDAVPNLSEFWYTKPTKILQIFAEKIGRGTVSRTSFPNDDTIPQDTEGSLMFTSSGFTPKSATSKILIELNFFAGETANNLSSAGSALFISGTSDALVSMSSGEVTNNPVSVQESTHILNAVVDSWGLTERTFTVRLSEVDSYNYMHVGAFAPSAKLGASADSLFKITEYEA